MKITADAKALSAAITWGTKGANRSPGSTGDAIVVVGSVAGSTLELFSFDGSGYFSAKVDVNRELDDNEDMTFKVSAPQFATLAGLLKSGDAILTIGAKMVTVAFGRSRFDFAQIVSRITPPPGLPGVIGTASISDLRATALHAATVASSDPTVPVLTSVLAEFDPEEATLLFEATDRYRMVIRSFPYAPAAEADKVAVLVPAVELKRLLSDLPSSGDVDVRAGGSYFGVSSDSFAGYVTVLDGQPVPYKRMLEQPFPNRVVVNRNDLRAAVTNVTSMSDNGDRIVLMVSADEITVMNSSRSAETTVDYVTPPVLEDETFHIGYHPAYLTGALTAAKSEDVSLAFSHPSNKPTIFHELSASGVDDMTYNHIVMPLR